MFANISFSFSITFEQNNIYRSGGPLMDIVETAEGSRTGYLAVDPSEYANSLACIIYGTKQQNDKIRAAAR